MDFRLRLIGTILCAIPCAFSLGQSAPKPLGNFEQPNHGWLAGFLQSQFTNLESGGATTSDFRARRTRMIYNYMGDLKTLGRFSVEFSSGVNQETAQVKDAYIEYRPATFTAKSGPRYVLGESAIPLGYELNYLSSIRLWPEYSIYNQAYFSGEVTRGALYQNGDANRNWFIGFWNSLTINDPEVLVNTKGPSGEVGPLAGIHVRNGDLEAGLSTFAARRPAFANGATTIGTDDRRFTYFDIRLHPAQSKFDLRAEAMQGRDRVPGTVMAATTTSGFHLNLDYKLNNLDTIVLRHEQWDADTGGSLGTAMLSGVAVVRDVTNNFRLSAALQWTTSINPSTANETSAQQLLFRAQLKF